VVEVTGLLFLTTPLRYGACRRVLMEPRLTRGEYWLLETAVQYRIPSCCLGRSPKGVEEQFNKPGHGMDRALLIESLARLRDDGLIDFARCEDVEKRIWLSNEGIADALSERRPQPAAQYTIYGLTGVGGACWEAFARPNWEQFVHEEFDDEAKDGVLTCMSETHLNRHLRDMNAAYVLLDNLVNIEPIGEWQATYWRSLLSGYRATVGWSAIRRGFRFFERRRTWYRWN
jgi:hypothetical protein